MGDIIKEYTSQYDVGDVIIFKCGSDIGFRMFLGIIEGYYIDHNCNESFWYNVRVNSKEVFTYSHRGDIAEWDIVGKIDSELKDKCFELIANGDEE